MLRELMPRFYILFAVLTVVAVVLTVAAISHDNTGATVGWTLASILGVAVLLAPLVMRTLMMRVRPVSRRGRHAER